MVKNLCDGERESFSKVQGGGPMPCWTLRLGLWPLHSPSCHLHETAPVSTGDSRKLRLRESMGLVQEHVAGSGGEDH